MGSKAKGRHWFVRYLEKVEDDGLESMGRYYGEYRALVDDREDPKHLGRIKLIIPIISGDLPYDYWAFPVGNYSGDGYGAQCIPNKGDMVWVSFDMGDPEYPIWKHGHFGEGEPPEDDQLKNYDSYWFRSPKGNMVLIDDTKGTIYVRHSEGQALEIDKESISLISGEKISLGQKKTSDEPAVLGDKNEDVLEEIKDILEKLVGAISKDVAASTSGSSPMLLYTNMASELPQLIPQLIQLGISIPKTKSDKVSLD